MNMLGKRSVDLAHKPLSLCFLDLFLTYIHILTGKYMQSFEKGKVISWTEHIKLKSQILQKSRVYYSLTH